jgi:hypothetical protein
VLLFGLASLDEALLWHFSITIKQPSAYIRFLTRELTHSDMFSHRQLLRTVVSLSNVTASTPHSGLAGITFYVSGKISVGGNSRSRHMMYFGGLRAPSRLFLEARTSCGIINTVTGCLGVNLTFYY